MKAAAWFLAVLLPATGWCARQENFSALNDVAWHTLGTNENDSMPLGNGDLALNVWTEQNGDVVLLLAKADAWSENGQLLKLGKVRVRLTPSPFVGQPAFTQSLKLETGDVEIRAGGNTARIWVDANRPAVHVEVRGRLRMSMEVVTEPWRTRPYHLDPPAVSRAGFFEWGNNPEGLDFDPDTILPAEDNQVCWFHFNRRSIYPLVFQQEHLDELLPKYPDPLWHRCFGVALKGPHLVSVDDRTLRSASRSPTQRLDLYALTGQANPDAWRANLGRLITSVDATRLSSAWKGHVRWWTDFWDRSWIHAGGSPAAERVSQGYAMQRYLVACAGRGAQPIKFNGALFTVGHALPPGASSTAADHDPDYRAWGASFWNQNTRLIYWPLPATGDNDLLEPWFDMYVQALPLVQDRTARYFHHGGGAFIETLYFWGLPNVNDFGWNNPGPELASEWMRYHIQGGLEVLAQMLDRYDYRPEPAFARDRLLPMADAVLTFYDQHWPRDTDGRILMSPAQSIETYQKTAVNPTPDIAGLRSVLPRLLALPAGLSTPGEQSLWRRLQGEVPPLPMGQTAKGKLPPQGHGDADGSAIILPARSYGDTRNAENPELYTVFPYRLYGVGKPGLQLARDTFAARLFPFSHCWGQDGAEAALLGLTEAAREVVCEEFTWYGDERFPWFWAKGGDWIPDMDNGGAGMCTLQLMLLQCDGKRIQLLPAWPKDWTADFKLHAPGQTVIEGHVAAGQITRLNVMPSERKKDIVVVRPDSPPPLH